MAGALHSSILLILRSMTLRGIGLISTVVLARILGPEDFGIVALAMLLIGLLEVLVQTGSDQYVLRAAGADTKLVNTAWTLNVSLRGTIALVLVVAAPLLGRLYGKPELVAVLWSLTAIMFIDALKNPGLWLLQREQDYRSIVRLDLLAKLLSVIVAVTAALSGAAYWALVAGRATMALTQAAGSYVIHEYRPRLSLAKLRRQFGFSLWLLLQSLFGYTRVNVDAFLVSVRFDNSQLGAFHTMKYLAFIPSENLIQPVSAPLLRELSVVRDEPQRFRLLHNATFLALAFLAVPLASILFGCADLLVPVLLGSGWVEYSELLAWFSILIAAFFLFNHATRTCITFGNARATFLYEVFAAAVIFIPILVIGIGDLTAFTSLRVQLELVASFCFVAYSIIFYTGFKNFLRVLAGLAPIALACAAAEVATQGLDSMDWGAFAKLAVALISWSVCYLAVFAMLLLLGFRRVSEWSFLIERVRKEAGRLLYASSRK
ncbi:MAG: oligosaccharide flippase family protein [Pseudomonadota bacterium]